MAFRETRVGECLLWTLDRPDRRNAVTPAMLDAMAERASTLNGEVVVLRGSGDRAFCAGFDLDALAERRDEALPDAPLVACTRALRQAKAVFVAAISGVAIGAGVELACTCDFRIARPGATFEIPAGRLGVVYHHEGIRWFRAVLGSAMTARLLIAGERVAVEDLVPNAIHALDVDPFARALALAEQVAAQDLEGRLAHRRLLRALDDGGVDALVLESHERARIDAWARIGAESQRQP
jgi:enoyl-CoA hydratase/carnithine racemase